MQLRSYSKKWYSNLFVISIENPFKTWWKARKYFKFPNIRIRFSTSKTFHPYASSYRRGKILDILIHDLYWKDKFNSPRHERNPLIYICLFNRFSLWIIFYKKWIDEFGDEQNYSMEYWEYLLDYLYYTKSLKVDSYWQLDSFENAKDSSKDKRVPMKLYIPTHLFSLNKKGLKEFKKLYDKSNP